MKVLEGIELPPPAFNFNPNAALIQSDFDDDDDVQFLFEQIRRTEQWTAEHS